MQQASSRSNFYLHKLDVIQPRGTTPYLEVQLQLANDVAEGEPFYATDEVFKVMFDFRSASNLTFVHDKKTTLNRTANNFIVQVASHSLLCQAN